MPTSKLLYLTLILLISLTLFTNSINSTATEEESDEIEDLIALDTEQDEQSPSSSSSSSSSKASSGAEVLTKAQRIVLELNNDNTQNAIDGNEYVFVVGYAPWDVRSAELMPRFAEAAGSLKELECPVLMAKIDAERYPKVASDLGVKGYPTLLLFVNGSSRAYTGGFSSEEIVIWVRKKTGTPIIRINSNDEAGDFVKKHSMFAVGFFNTFEGSDYEEFVKAAATDNEFQFVETSVSQVASILFQDVKPISPFLGIVKSEPERYTSYDDAFEKEKILQFLSDNKFPLVTFLTEVNSIKVYASDKLQVYVFAEADEFPKLLEPFQNAARKFKSKIMFVFVDIKDDNLAKPFLTLFGLEDSEDTLVTAFDYKTGAKYLLESNPTPANIEEFGSRLLTGTLPPFYKSQAIPDNTILRSSKIYIELNITTHRPQPPQSITHHQSPSPSIVTSLFSGLQTLKTNSLLLAAAEGPPLLLRMSADVKGEDIVTVVGKTFDELVLSSSKNIVLEIHTPWCLNCETTHKQVEKLAKHFKGLENLVFAKIDASVNEHPKLEVEDYPTLLFYPVSNKSNPIKLPTKSSSKDLAIVINKYLKDQARDKQQVTKDEL